MRFDNFDMFRTLLKQRSGLELSQDKVYLLESRLMPVARKWNLRGLEELASTIRTKRDEQLLQDITEAMTTNESSFFRDSNPFDQFRKIVLPHLLERRATTRRIRIWCAAASSGQEPYSLAIILKEEAARLPGWRVDIIGTDLSTEVLEKARQGVYTQFEVQRGLPVSYLVKYFKQIDDKWELDLEIRRMVEYQEFNLLNDPAPLGRFDVIFCRNVLIYFDQDTKGEVLGRIAKQISGDGILYLGGAETVLGITDKFRRIEGQRGIYQPTGDDADGAIAGGAKRAAVG
ncbi:MAG: protein-glutamate O-methyltransferase [Alphaproteobacteria bacterium]